MKNFDVNQVIMLIGALLSAALGWDSGEVSTGTELIIAAIAGVTALFMWAKNSTLFKGKEDDLAELRATVGELKATNAALTVAAMKI